MDNRMFERLWRGVNGGEIYLRDYLDGLERVHGLSRGFVHHNQTPPHQSPGHAPPGDIHGDPGAHGAQLRKR